MSTQKNYRRGRSYRGSSHEHRNGRRSRRDSERKRSQTDENKQGGIVAFFKRLFGIDSTSQKPQKLQENQSRGGREGMFISERKEKERDSRPRSKEKTSDRLQGMLDTPPEVEVCRLYIGNLAYDTAESDLFDLFSQVGAVKNVEIVRDRQNSSKGFGFVEMQSLDTAKAAAVKFHRFEFMGRPLVVSGAKP